MASLLKHQNAEDSERSAEFGSAQYLAIDCVGLGHPAAELKGLCHVDVADRPS